MKYWRKLLQSPFTLSLLVGLYPVLFYISNNWFMFKASQSLLIVGAFTLIVFLALSFIFTVISWFVRKLYKNSPEKNYT